VRPQPHFIRLLEYESYPTPTPTPRSELQRALRENEELKDRNLGLISQLVQSRTETQRVQGELRDLKNTSRTVKGHLTSAQRKQLEAEDELHVEHTRNEMEWPSCAPFPRLHEPYPYPYPPAEMAIADKSTSVLDFLKSRACGGRRAELVRLVGYLADDVPEVAKALYEKGMAAQVRVVPLPRVIQLLEWPVEKRRQVVSSQVRARVPDGDGGDDRQAPRQVLPAAVAGLPQLRVRAQMEEDGSGQLRALAVEADPGRPRVFPHGHLLHLRVHGPTLPYPYPYPRVRFQKTRDETLKRVGIEVITSRDYEMAAPDDPRLFIDIRAITDSSRKSEFAVVSGMQALKLMVHTMYRAEAHPNDPNLNFDARDGLRCVLPYPTLPIRFLEWLLTLPLAACCPATTRTWCRSWCTTRTRRRSSSWTPR